tara:strand:- start:68 stop:484 length:417 start_codon:yes stop_codon:yes gene_type:complete
MVLVFSLQVGLLRNFYSKDKMDFKVEDHLKAVPELPELIRTKKNRPPKMAVVDEDNCTGCSACVPFCPVDCIEPVSEDKYNDVSIPPVQVRWNECIGCQVCAKVCDKLTWNAIRMIPTNSFEERYEFTVDKKIDNGQI